MLYKAKVAVCSEIHTKHSKQSERHIELVNVKPCVYVKKPLGFKTLRNYVRHAVFCKATVPSAAQEIPNFH